MMVWGCTVVPTVRVERVAGIPGGGSWRVLQRDGEIVLQLLDVDVSNSAAEEIQRLFQNSVDSGRWTQNWPALETAAPDASVPTARAERVGTIPGGRPAMVLESNGEFVLLLLEDEVSERGTAAVNQALRDETGSGRWTQNWPGDQRPGQPPTAA